MLTLCCDIVIQTELGAEGECFSVNYSRTFTLGDWISYFQHSTTFVSHGLVPKSDEAITLPHWVSLALLWGITQKLIAKATNAMPRASGEVKKSLQSPRTELRSSGILKV